MTKHHRPKALLIETKFASISASAYLPRQATSTKNDRRVGVHYGEISHGITRAIESLRGLRLSLVPLPMPGDSVLPGVRYKAEGLSFAGEPKAPRASVPQIAGPGFCLG